MGVRVSPLAHTHTSDQAKRARLRGCSSARASYTRQVKECLAMLADLIDNPDRQVGEREAVFTLSVLVGAISMARAVDDPCLSQQIPTNAAAALKERIPNS